MLPRSVRSSKALRSLLSRLATLLSFDRLAHAAHTRRYRHQLTDVEVPGEEIEDNVREGKREKKRADLHDCNSVPAKDPMQQQHAEQWNLGSTR